MKNVKLLLIACFLVLSNLPLEAQTEFTSLDEALKHVETAEVLNLSGQMLTELPAEVGQLLKLKRLDLWKNRLTKLPEQIALLTNLEELILTDNLLTELPEGISELTNLKTLSLSKNKLAQLPDSIIKLKNVTTFAAEWNNLGAACFVKICQLTALDDLNLAHNENLKLIPPDIKNLTNLLVLDLTFVGISILPEEICNLTLLEELNLSGNQLQKLPNNLDKLENLEELNLKKNTLSGVEKAKLKKLPETTEIEF